MDVIREPELNEDMKVDDIVERIYEIAISSKDEHTELSALMFLYNHFTAKKDAEKYLQKYVEMMTILKK